jgi:AraC-like DNA-binding protein
MDARIRVVQRIIREQTRDIQRSLTTASTLLGLSAAQLRRLFKQNVGTSLREYVREMRMARAAETLADYRLSVKEIASDLGYKDISNFYRDFRIVHGTTPQQLRARQLNLLANSSGPLRNATTPLSACKGSAALNSPPAQLVERTP